VTRFGVTALLASLVLVLFSIVDDRTDNTVEVVLLVLAAVLVGAVVAVEARHQHLLSLHKKGEQEEDEET
jgi:hypothetical protein